MTTTAIAMPNNLTTLPARHDGREPNNGSPPPSSAASSAKAEALPVDLTNLPDGALALLAEAVPREIAARQTKREADFLAYVREHAQVLGIPTARLAARLAGKSAKTSTPRIVSDAPGEDDGRRHVRAKYRSKDGQHVWAGRGAAPAWMADHLAAGGKKEDLAIVEGAPASGDGL